MGPGRDDQPATRVIEIRLTIDLRTDGSTSTHRVDVPLNTVLQGISHPAIQSLPVVVPLTATAGDRRTLVELHDELLAERDREHRVAAKTQKDNRAMLRRFEEWLDVQHGGTTTDYLSAMQAPNVLRQYAEYLRSQTKGNSASMCSKALATIGKVAGACVKAGLIRQKPESVTRASVNMLRPRSEKQRRVKAVPVSVEELQAMLAVVDGCTWPRLGNVPPSVFWETCLLSHYAYGFRSQDWYACRCAEKKGLLWSGVVDGTECPWIEGLHNEAGWCWYLVHKTSKKDEQAERPSDVLVPLSNRMRSLIERFRGIDPERAFPMRNNSATYSQEFAKLLERAGLSDEVREREGKPIIRLSLGQRNVASFRKGASAMWARQVGKSASSYLLHHAVAEEGVAKMTQESYLQNEDILRDITAKIEHLPIWYL
jgi:hypothetical protein